jgi:hypothetical protein
MSEMYMNKDRKDIILKQFTAKGGNLRTPADPQVFYFLINTVINDDGFFTRWVVKQCMADQNNIIYEYINKNFMDKEGKSTATPLISAVKEDIFDVMMKTELGRIKGGKVNGDYTRMIDEIAKNRKKWKKMLLIPDDDDAEESKEESKVMSKSKDNIQKRDVLRENFADYVISIFAYISRIYPRGGAKKGGGKIQKGGSKILMYVVGVFTCFITYCQISTWMSLHISRQARTYEWKIAEFKKKISGNLPNMLAAVEGASKNILHGCDSKLKLSNEGAQEKTDKKPESGKQLTTLPNEQLVTFFEQGTGTVVLSGVLSDFEKSLKCLGNNITSAINTDIFEWGKDISKPIVDSPEYEEKGQFEWWFEKFTQIYSVFESPKSAANQVVLNVAADGTTIILKATEKGFALTHLTKEGINLINQLTKVGVNGITQAIAYAKWMLFVEHIGWNLFSAGIEEMFKRRHGFQLAEQRREGAMRLLTNDAPFAARYGVYFGPRSTIAAFLFQVGWRSSRYAWQTHIEPGILNLYRGLYFNQPPPDDLNDFNPERGLLVRDTSMRSQSDGVEVSFDTGTSPSPPPPSSPLVVQEPSFSKKAEISEDKGIPGDLLGGRKTRKKRRKKNKTKHKRSKRRKSRKKRRKKKHTRKH